MKHEKMTVAEYMRRYQTFLARVLEPIEKVEVWGMEIEAVSSYLSGRVSVRVSSTQNEMDVNPETTILDVYFKDV